MQHGFLIPLVMSFTHAAEFVVSSRIAFSQICICLYILQRKSTNLTELCSYFPCTFVGEKKILNVMA